MHVEAFHVFLRDVSAPVVVDAGRDPDLHACRAEALDQRKQIQKAPRFASSTASCYAEFVTGVIFYQRAAMYGSNLFGGFVVRDFSKGAKPKVSAGMVKNPLEAFPAKTPDQTETARVELVDAWSKDFGEWLSKKYKR